MAVEARAAVEILTKLGEIVLRTCEAYKRASAEIRNFPRQVEELKIKLKEWENLLEKYPQHVDDSVVARLKVAREVLEEELKRFEKLQQACRWSMFWKKLTFSPNLLVNWNAVFKAFDNITGGMNETEKAEKLLKNKANNRLAPFPFSKDDKYVPINETLDKIQRALEVETPSGTLVLLHGESGEGKSTLVKYLALECQEKLENGESRFPGGIYFLTCGKKASPFLLLKQLWEDLGVGIQESECMPSERSPQDMNGSDFEQRQRIFEQEQRKAVETLRRKLMGELDSRKSQPMLIIVDDVWEQELIGHLRFSYKHIKYLVISQKSDLCQRKDVTEVVPIAKPSMEEARQILFNHSGRSTVYTLFTREVQEEVDKLIKQVDKNPLVLANLGAMTMDFTDKDPASDQDSWKKLRCNLHDMFKEQKEADTPQPTAFGEPYKLRVGASLTLAIQYFTHEAQTLILLVAICSGSSIDEAVLKIWFNKIYGRSSGGSKFNSSSKQMKKRSFIVAETSAVEWGKEPCTRWSIHDLRRQFICEHRESDIADLIKRLIESQAEEEDDDFKLVAALCLLYGNEICCRQVELKLGVCEPLQIASKHPDAPRRKGRLEFIKSFVILLHPNPEEEWQKRSHNLAKEVIIHFLQCGKLKDEAVSQLLKMPETVLPTCFAVKQSSWLIVQLVKDCSQVKLEPILGLKECLESFTLICSSSAASLIQSLCPLSLLTES